MRKTAAGVLLFLCLAVFRAPAGALDAFPGDVVPVSFQVVKSGPDIVSAILALHYDHNVLEMTESPDFENDGGWLYDPAGISDGRTVGAVFRIREDAAFATYSVWVEAVSVADARENAVKDGLVLSQNYIDVIPPASAAPPPMLKKGGIIRFGRYETDGNADNGPEPLTWYVTETSNGVATLLCRICVDAVKYDGTMKSGVTWKDCTLRKWMNGTFYQAAFDKLEKEKILDTALYTTQTHTAVTVGTTDRVFALAGSQVHPLPAAWRTARPAWRYRGRLGFPSFWWTRDGDAVNAEGEIAGWGIGEDSEIRFYNAIGYGEIGARPAVCVAVDAFDLSRKSER